MISLMEMICIIVSLVCPPLGVLLSLFGLLIDKRKWKLYIFGISWGIGVLAYCYEPIIESDLVRYYNYVKALDGKTFLEALNVWNYGHNNLYSFVLLCWSITKIGDYRLLPAVTTFIVYYIGLYITCRTSYDLENGRKYVFKCVMFIIMMVSFYSIVNNIRNVCAFAMITYAVYRECYEKKKNWFTLFLYVFPIFLHTSAIIFIALRFFVKIGGKLKVFLIGLIVMVPTLLGILSTQFGDIISKNIFARIIINTIISGNNYFEHTDVAWAITAQNSGSIRLTKILCLTYMAYLALLIFVLAKRGKKNKADLNVPENLYFFSDYIFFVSLLALACTPMVMPEYWRFASIAVLVGNVPLLIADKMFGGNKIYSFLFQIMFFVIGIPNFILAIRNLFLYSDVIIMLERALICNPIIMLFIKDISIVS